MSVDSRDFERGRCGACGTVAIRSDQGWWAHRDTRPCDWRVTGFERACFVATETFAPVGGEDPAGAKTQ